jgi:hypothetical protein
MKFSTAWAMPNKWTFQQKPVEDFLCRWINPTTKRLIIDPFAGTSKWAEFSNDLVNGIDAEAYCCNLLAQGMSESADIVLFDPPYSPRQISECYKSIGKKVTTADTQNAALYARVRKPLGALLKPGGVALSFGWQSGGFGKAWPTEEILLVQHGGAHNDTICVAQRKPYQGQL